MAKTALPTLLNVVRILLSVKLIYVIVSFIVFLIGFNQNMEAYLGFLRKGDDLAYASGVILARMLFIIGPSLLAVIFITKRKFKLTVTFLSLALFVAIPNESNLFTLIHLFALLIVLLHRPSKMYLQRKDTPVNEAVVEPKD
ncbi:hypothetical protein BS614_26060 [Paenibacillus xylanexedens]|uniref:hypothetical protein n=1 Tax=Paenibacillus xylanexedens TaxID=528191 RepID=UPI0009382AEF|nr:hypothetical protein [Paenibacillus xylanexedens]APO47174.1 hypothetical protein BS614_26060 [Paenibacillus xylanexedens]